MSDPVSILSGVMSLGQGLFQFLDYIKSLKGSDVISAYFNHNGELIDGDKRIKISKISDAKSPDNWYYHVNEIEDYTFTRIPVGASSLIELIGHTGEKNYADTRFWRWVSQQAPGRIIGGQASNALVNFIVIGYKPKSVISHFSSS